MKTHQTNNQRVRNIAIRTIGFLTFVLMVVVISSCSNDSDITLDEDDYLIFGHFYGMCVGERCVEIYKLTETRLYEDVNDNYLLTDFNFKRLSNYLFEQVRDLPGYLPDELLNTDEDTFGCPDCADQGGIFIQLSQNGTVRTWKIDQMKSNVPDYLNAFVDKVNEKIDMLGE